MFYYNDEFNQPLDNWNVSNTMYVHSMFFKCKKFHQKLDKWDINDKLKMSTFINSIRSDSESESDYDAYLENLPNYEQLQFLPDEDTEDSEDTKYTSSLTKSDYEEMSDIEDY